MTRPEITRQGINSLADSKSPFKWTKTALQSDLSDFSFEPVVLTTGWLLQLVETLHVTSLQA